MKCPKCGQKLSWKGFRARHAVRVTYECQNVQCGYKSQPGYGETIDVANKEAKLSMRKEETQDLKTASETKKALSICKTRIKGSCVADCHKNCPYYAVEGFCRNRLHDDAHAYIETLESTYSQVSKALCGNENASLCDVLRAADQLKKQQEWHRTADNDYPDDEKVVLIAYQGIDIVTTGYWDARFAEWCDVSDEKITSPQYWKELPEAPKEADNAEQ